VDNKRYRYNHIGIPTHKQMEKEKTARERLVGLFKNPANQGLVAELIDEHTTAREYIKNITEAMENYATGTSEAATVAENMEKYILLLTEHVRKENSDLFPAANKELSEETQKDMVEQFEKFEHDVIGEGKHEEYHGWLEDLKKKYLD